MPADRWTQSCWWNQQRKTKKVNGSPLNCSEPINWFLTSSPPQLHCHWLVSHTNGWFLSNIYWLLSWYHIHRCNRRKHLYMVTKFLCSCWDLCWYKGNVAGGREGYQLSSCTVYSLYRCAVYKLYSELGHNVTTSSSQPIQAISWLFGLYSSHVHTLLYILIWLLCRLYTCTVCKLNSLVVMTSIWIWYYKRNGSVK